MAAFCTYRFNWLKFSVFVFAGIASCSLCLVFFFFGLSSEKTCAPASAIHPALYREDSKAAGCFCFCPFSPQLVELKNGETYNGHLVSCDNWMNINLREVICTSRVKLSAALSSLLSVKL